MIDNLPAYPAYRDSELPWIGAIPVHWDILRNGRLFTHCVETGFPDLPILEVSLRTGVRVRDLVNLKRKQMMTQKEKYKRAVKGDIAYNMMRMWQGALGVAPVDGLVSPAYVVVRPFDGVNSAYYDYLFRTGAYMSEVNKYSRGIVSDRNRLYWDEFKQMPSIIPSRDEQDKIVAFLRAQDRQIARFIRDKRRLVELLNEQKQTIIHRAVTRGLDPNVRLRPSGIDWLGDVPEHWEIRRLKTIASIIMGQSPSSTDCNHDGNGFPFLQGCAEFGVVNPEPVQYCPTPPKKAPEGSILLSVRAPVGSMNVANKIYGIGRGLCAISRGSSLDHYFLFYSLVDSKTQFKIASTGSTYDAVSTKDVGNLLSTFPTLFEQEQISKFVTNETISLEDAIAKTKYEIDLIREYRERLISDVVTGKVDLRGWTPAPEDLAADDEELAVIGDDEENPAEEEGDAND